MRGRTQNALKCSSTDVTGSYFMTRKLQGDQHLNNACKYCRTQTGLTDGNWVFQVQALAASGVSGTAVSASFLVDSTAPIISKLVISYTANKQTVNVTVGQSGGSASVPTKAFQIYTVASDGLLGSGLAANG